MKVNSLSLDLGYADEVFVDLGTFKVVLRGGGSYTKPEVQVYDYYDRLIGTVTHRAVDGGGSNKEPYWEGTV
jgi:hypothetical protein